MAGYVRNDTPNNIADGNIINASDLDGEFDSLQSAFGATGGHSHSGAAGEGKPIEKVGPAQDLSVSTSAVTPKTNNILDLGSSSFKFKDAYVAGKVDTGTLTLGGTAVTSSAAELNLLDGVTASTTELNYVTGVTSSIQTQLGTKQATITGAASTVVSSNLTADFAMVSDATGKIAVHPTVTSTELGYLDGVTSSIQTQFGTKAPLDSPALTGNVTILDNSASPALTVTQTGTGRAFVVEDSASPDLTPFIIDTVGNVGIGVAPAVALDIGNQVTPQVRLVSTTNAVDLRMQSLGSLATAVVGTLSNHPMVFFVNNTEKVRIDTLGNVGIGGTSSTERLEVYGSALAKSVSSGTVSVLAQTGTTTDYSVLKLRQSTTESRIEAVSTGTAAFNPLTFLVGAGERFRIGTAGQLGIGGANYGTTGQTIVSAGSAAAPAWGTLPVSGGGTGATTGAGAFANMMGYTTTATAAGTTTLTNTSTQYQLFTGSTTQTIVLPVTSTLTTGWTFHIVNNSTGNLTVNSSGGNLVATVVPNTTAMVTCIGTTLTTAADWEYGFTDFGSVTGTGSVVLAASPTLTGTPLAPTAALSTNTTQLATTAFVVSQIGNDAPTKTGTGASGTWGISISGNAATATSATSATSATTAGSATSATSATTASTANALNTANNYQVNSLGVGTAASGTAGEIRATNNVTAYYSDDRLKTRLGTIEDPIGKIMALSGFYYEANEVAQAFGYEVKKEVGVSAQQVQSVMPEVVAPAPIDERYLTVRYERLVPLLIEAIKAQQTQIEELTEKLGLLV